ncbi:MAG TPA: glycerate kinase [Feifaniaceae bacterium]|nr:glycerate kinase [Feifaniaceae bacterium]
MQIRKFSLGLRFDIMAGEEGQATPAQIWEEIFSVLTTNDTKGLQLYGGMASFEYSPAGPYYLCVLTNGSLKQLRRVYGMLERDEGIGMYLTATHPFLQNNELERVEGLTYYGKVQGDGSLSGGEEPLFDVCICKKRGKRRPVGKGIVFLLAPDAFYPSLSSKQAIRRLTLAARKQIPGVRVLPLPIADGRPGTVDAILTARNGTMRRVQITGPQGEKREACYAVFGGRTAVIEMPESFCGPIPSRELHSSFGMGELIRRALDEGLSEIYIGLGPGSINDGGLGCLRALGVKILNAEGGEVNTENEAAAIAKIDTELLHPRIRNTRFVMMTDDDARFSKELLYEPLRASYAALVKEAAGFDVYGQPAAGAAGGLGAALFAFFGAAHQSGIEALLNIYEFDRRAKNVSLILTGEGCLDASSFAPGRAVGAILARASRMKVPACVIAGRLGEGGEELLQKRDCSSMLFAETPCESAAEELTERFDGEAERMFGFIRLGREIERVSARKNKR